MSRFEENIFGLVAKKDLLQIGYDVTRPNDPVDQLIDDDKTDNLIAEWESLAAEYGIRLWRSSTRLTWRPRRRSVSPSIPTTSKRA